MSQKKSCLVKKKKNKTTITAQEIKKRRRKQHSGKEKEKKKEEEEEEESNWTNCPCASVYGHFHSLNSSIFSLFWRENFLVDLGRKYLNLIIYFPSSPPN